MYFLLELTILIIMFSTVHGKITQCFVGGLPETICDVYKRESVVEKYYIDYFKKVNNLHDITAQENFDIPHTKYSRLGNNSSGGASSSSLSSMEQYTERKNIRNSMRILHIHPRTPIREVWVNIILNGTDIHKLKFHSKLVNMQIQMNRYFTEEDKLVYINSCYVAASTYFLYKNSQLALDVLEDGRIIINQLDMNLELLVWSILYSMLKLNIMETIKSYEYEYIIYELNILNENEKILHETVEKENLKYPIAYLLMFREYFLDEEFSTSKTQYLNGLIKFGQNMENEIHTVYVTLFPLYHNLVLYFINYIKLQEIYQFTAFQHLIQAIKTPISCVEERLLNYKANEIMLKELEICFDYIEWTNEKNEFFCNQLKQNYHNDHDFKRILLNFKNLNMYPYILHFLTANLGNSNSNTDIDENILHTIVTLTINMDNTNIQSSQQTVHFAIQLLIDYIEMLKSEQHNTELTTNHNAMTNMYKAYKWLAELNGVLCTSYTNDDQCKKSTESALESALDLANNFNILDDHLQFLKCKRYLQLINLQQSWESKTRLDGWVLKDPNLMETNIYYSLLTNGIEMCGEDQILHLVDSSNVYVNQIEVMIYLFRIKYKDGYYDDAHQWIMKALSYPVVGSEDRYRNKEAHELYSMYLMEHNRKIV